MVFALTLLGVAVALMACAVPYTGSQMKSAPTYYALRNGRTIKENTTRILGSINEGFNRMDEGFRLIALLIIAETSEEKKELAKRILEKKV